LCLITQIILGEQYKFWSSSCSTVQSSVELVPLTKTLHVLRLQVEGMASRCGGWVWLYWISSWC
jgi:hypothetical protein